MARIAIVTDSNSGITQAAGKKLGVYVLPMPFDIDGQQYFEDINLTQEQFYEKLTGDADVSTSQPSPDAVMSLWDVIASCDIIGSSDSSIKNVVANDIGRVLSEAPIRQIFVNGQTAFKLYKKYVFPETGVMPVCLPSTSPANAAWNMEKLTEAWQVIVRES